MRPPNTISNSESQTSFLSLIFSEGRGGGSVHRLGIPSKEGSEITNSVQINYILAPQKTQQKPISFLLKAPLTWNSPSLMKPFNRQLEGTRKAKKEKRKKGNKMDGNNRCMGKFGNFRAIFYF